MKANGNRQGRILRAVGLPLELLSGLPVVELKGGQEAVVIHHRGIDAYDPCEVRVLSGIGTVRIGGEGLRIGQMNRERIVIVGTVREIRLGEV